MLDAAKEFEASGKSRNYFAQQNMLRKKTMQEIVVQRETERANVEKVNTLDQQLTDKFNELMIKRVQLRGTIHKEAENTQKKLEKVREDIKKEEKQTQGLSANKIFINSSFTCVLCASIICINKFSFINACLFCSITSI
jgi:hypothetical protein